MARKWTLSQEAAMSVGGKTLLVSAAAGSGKTSVLTERIIRSLTNKENPADLSRILVVTFTRAAAAELKARIAKAIGDALSEDPENANLSRQLFLLGSAQISTIDAFFQKAVRANFERLGVPATFRIADDSEINPLALEILDSLIKEFYERYGTSASSTDPLADIRKNRFARNIDHLMANRSDGKLDGLLLIFYRGFSRYPSGISLLRDCANTLRAQADAPFFESDCGRSLGNRLMEQFSSYLSLMEDLCQDLRRDADNYMKLSGLLSSDMDFCHAMISSLKEGNYDIVKSVAYGFVTGKFPRISEKSDTVLLYQKWRNTFKEDIKKVQETLSGTGENVRLQMERTAEFCEMLYQFFAEYQLRFLEEKKARGILEYDDVRAMLYGLLTNPDGSPSSYADELSAQYDAVYIDEYQDVDHIQDRIFSLIGRNKRFMVGDIKQSIYGFRGSEPSIFAEYRRAMPLFDDEGASGADGACVFMSENFRCDQPVIDFTNKVCSFLFSACEESVGYRPQDDLICSKNPPESNPDVTPTPVFVAVFDKPSTSRQRDAEEESEDEESARAEVFWTAREIARLLREERLDDGSPITPSDIAILVRAKAHGDAYAKELSSLGIPVATAAGNDLLYHPLMNHVLNLLRAIDNPYRDLPLSEFLLSPLGGYTLEDLAIMRGTDSSHLALYDALSEMASRKENSPLKEKASCTVEWLKKQQERASILPADRFLRLLYLEKILLPYRASPVLLFLYEQARVWQRTAFCGLYGFLGHLSRLMENGKISAGGFCKAEKAVTIMTIHHSKGLEFPVVFVSNCGSHFNQDDMKRPILFHKRLGCATRLYNADTGESEDTILRTALTFHTEHEQTEESIRALYVALTRARERLYVTGTLTGPWESAELLARSTRRGNRFSILKCKSYLQWILAALAEKPFQKGQIPCKFRHFSTDEVFAAAADVPFEMTAADTASSAPSTPAMPANPSLSRYARVLKEQESFVYPLRHLEGLPTKAAASRLKSDLLDTLLNEETDDGLDAMLAQMQAACPDFEHLLLQSKKPSAAEIGTATHAFLEYCDFSLLRERGIESERERLIREGFLTRATAEIIHREQLEAFLESDLLDRILRAKRVRREQRFGLFLPMRDFTSDTELAKRLGEEALFVQGSIDLLLETEDDRLVLIDYKTDRITDAERKSPALLQEKMKHAHAQQLDCYARAVEHLFGRAPDEIYIYSLPFGGTIKM